MSDSLTEDPLIRLRIVLVIVFIFIALYPVHAAKDDIITTTENLNWDTGSLHAPIIIETVRTELNTVKNYGNGTCVPYARSRTGIQLFGSAKTFISQATENGYHVSSNPIVGAMVVTSESYVGHVAVVEGVYDEYIIISEQNYQGLYKISTRKLLKSDTIIVGYIY